MTRKRHNPTTLEERIRTRIRRLRKERRLTQEQLCDLAGISRDAISRIEGGSRAPTLSTLERVAAALGASWADIVGDGPELKHTHSLVAERVALLVDQQSEQVQEIAESLVRALVRSVERSSSEAADRAAEKPAPYLSGKKKP
ncbi:MAG: helix-turn-helix transcriptional regulator [Polyangia bacterium]